MTPISDNYNLAGRLLTVTLLLLALPGLLMAQVEKEKRISKSYKVTGNTEVSFSNSFGMMQIETWERNEVEVEILINVKMKNDRDAQKALDKIDVSINDSNPASRLSFSTDIRNMNNSNGESFSVDYMIKMPSNLKLEAINKFGETVIDNYSGELKLRNEYGHLRADRLTGNSEVEVKFGNGEIDYMKSGELIVSYSEFSADRIDDVKADLSFSEVEIDQVGSMDLKIKYGELKIDHITSLEGKGSFTSIEIERLSDRLVLEGSYISDLEINTVEGGFSLIDVKNSFGETKLGFDKGAGAEIEADFSFGELKYDKQLGINFSSMEEKNNNSSYRGSFGNGEGKVRLSGNYANGRLTLD